MKNTSLEKLPNHLTDVTQTVACFPYKFTIHYTGNEYCEDLIRVFAYQYHTNGIKAAVQALNDCKADFEIFLAGNWLQRKLTERWLTRELAEII